MKVHTTNYHDTFIVVADDCPTVMGEVPPRKGDIKSVANIQYDILSENPYRYTSTMFCFKFMQKEMI